MNGKEKPLDRKIFIDIFKIRIEFFKSHALIYLKIIFYYFFFKFVFLKFNPEYFKTNENSF